MAKLRRVGRLADYLLKTYDASEAAKQQSQLIQQRQQEAAAQAFADKVMSNPAIARSFTKAGVTQLGGMPLEPFAPSDTEVTGGLIGAMGKANTPGAVPGDEEIAAMLQANDVPLASYGGSAHTGTGLPERSTFRPSQNGELPSTVPNMRSQNLDTATQAATGIRARLQPEYDVEHSIDQTYRDESGQQFSGRTTIANALKQGAKPTERTAAQQGAYQGETKLGELNTPGLQAAEDKHNRLQALEQSLGQAQGAHLYTVPKIMYDSDTGQAHAYRSGPGGFEEVELPPGITDVKPMKLSAQQVNRRETAGQAIAYIGGIRQQLDEMDQRGLLGPIAGRVSDLFARKLKLEDVFTSLSDPSNTGISDPQEARLAANFFSSMRLLTSLAAVVHGGARGGGSPNLVKQMEQIVNGIGDKNLTVGQLDAMERLMRLYADQPDAPDLLDLRTVGLNANPTGSPVGAPAPVPPSINQLLNR